MSADVSLRPVAFAVCLVEPAGNNESGNVVASFAGDGVVSKSQYEVHAMLAHASAVIVKTSPRPGRKIHF